MFAFLQCLSHWNIFQYIEAGFLPGAHSQEDIDRPFRKISKRLRNEDVIILKDFFCTLRTPFGGQAQAVYLSFIVNQSEFCNIKRAFKSLPPFYHFRYFYSKLL